MAPLKGFPEAIETVFPDAQIPAWATMFMLGTLDY
jgi:transposase-like protein